MKTMTTEPMKCELCGQAAHRPAPYTWCETFDCPIYGNITYTVEQWNTLQTALIELQREAFEAGQFSVDRFGDIYRGFDDYLAERSAK